MNIKNYKEFYENAGKDMRRQMTEVSNFLKYMERLIIIDKSKNLAQILIDAGYSISIKIQNVIEENGKYVITEIPTLNFDGIEVSIEDCYKDLKRRNLI